MAGAAAGARGGTGRRGRADAGVAHRGAHELTLRPASARCGRDSRSPLVPPPVPRRDPRYYARLPPSPPPRSPPVCAPFFLGLTPPFCLRAHSSRMASIPTHTPPYPRVYPQPPSAVPTASPPPPVQPTQFLPLPPAPQPVLAAAVPLSRCTRTHQHSPRVPQRCHAPWWHWVGVTVCTGVSGPGWAGSSVECSNVVGTRFVVAGLPVVQTRWTDRHLVHVLVW